MPTINIYYKSDDQSHELEGITPDIKEYAAKILTCGDISLKPHEISVRLIKAGGAMIGEVEAEINAYAFDDRVKKQDELCLGLADFIQNKSSIKDVKAWLILSELGHSWED